MNDKGGHRAARAAKKASSQNKGSCEKTSTGKQRSPDHENKGNKDI